MADSQNAKLFQERRGLRPTRRGPGPQLGLAANAAHTVPLEPPLPLPEQQGGINGCPPPDAGRIPTWPHGEELNPDDV